MSISVTERVRKHRISLRASGLRPVQIWVPDTRKPEFAKECARQSTLVSKADIKDLAMLDFMDEALSDIDGWEE